MERKNGIFRWIAGCAIVLPVHVGAAASVVLPDGTDSFRVEKRMTEKDASAKPAATGGNDRMDEQDGMDGRGGKRSGFRFLSDRKRPSGENGAVPVSEEGGERGTKLPSAKTGVVAGETLNREGGRKVPEKAGETVRRSGFQRNAPGHAGFSSAGEQGGGRKRLAVAGSGEERGNTGERARQNKTVPGERTGFSETSAQKERDEERVTVPSGARMSARESAGSGGTALDGPAGPVEEELGPVPLPSSARPLPSGNNTSGSTEAFRRPERPGGKMPPAEDALPEAMPDAAPAGEASAGKGHAGYPDRIVYCGTTERDLALKRIDEAVRKPGALGHLGYFPEGLSAGTEGFAIEVTESDAYFTVTLSPETGPGNVYLFRVEKSTGAVCDAAEGIAPVTNGRPFP